RAALHRRPAAGPGGADHARGRLRRAGMSSTPAFRVGAALALALLLAFLALPLASIFVEAGPGELAASLGHEGAREALWLSLRTSVAALAAIVVIGTPAAYLVA